MKSAISLGTQSVIMTQEGAPSAICHNRKPWTLVPPVDTLTDDKTWIDSLCKNPESSWKTPVPWANVNLATWKLERKEEIHSGHTTNTSKVPYCWAGTPKPPASPWGAEEWDYTSVISNFHTICRELHEEQNSVLLVWSTDRSRHTIDILRVLEQKQH